MSGWSLIRVTKPLAPGSFVVIHRTLGSRGRTTGAVAGLEKLGVGIAGEDDVVKLVAVVSGG